MTAEETMSQVIDRMGWDEAFARQVVAAPLHTLRAAGYAVDTAGLGALLGAPEASDVQLSQLLSRRLSRACLFCYPTGGEI